MKYRQLPLPDMVARFFRKDFGVPEACDLLGPIERDAGKRIHLRPDPASNIVSAVLEIYHEPDQPPLLEGMSVEYDVPVLVDFQSLIQRFGPENELPRLKPWQDVPIQFLVKTKDFEGYVMLLTPVKEGTQNLAKRHVTSEVMRRFREVETATATTGSPRQNLRILAWGDFAASALAQEITITGLDDLPEAWQGLKPQFEGEIDNALGGAEKKLAVNVAPTGLDHFTADLIIQQVPPLAALLRMRTEIDAVCTGKPLLEPVEVETLPEPWQARLQRYRADDQPPGPKLIEEIDKALSAQSEILFADPRFHDFQAAWLGTQFLVENLKPAANLCLELRSHGKLEDVERVLTPNRYHPDQQPALLAIVAKTLNETDLAQLGEVASRGDIPVACSPYASTNFAGFSDRRGRFLVACLPRICLRPPLHVPEFAPRSFRFTRVKGLDTTVWGSGGWALAALCAASAATLGHLEPTAASIPVPPLPRQAPAAVPAMLENAAIPPKLGSSTLRYDAAKRTLNLTKLRAMNEGATAQDHLAARLIFSPLLQTIRRLRQFHPADPNPRQIIDPLKKALQARMPDGLVEVDVKAGRLKVEVIPTFPIEGKLTSFKYDEPWPGTS